MRNNTFIQRLKCACRFVIYGKTNARIMTCGKCGSQRIIPISSKPVECSVKEEDLHIDLYWAEFTQCLKCGAVCEEVQMWNFAGDPQKIDKDITVN